MKTITGFRDQSVLAEEAAEWLIRLDADTPPTREDLQQLGEWLQRSPAHREKLEGLAALWGRMNVLTDLAVPLGKHTRAAASMPPKRSGAPKRLSWRRHQLRTASVTALVITAIALGLALLVRAPATDPLLTTNGLYATAVGQQKTTTLADGSEIILNTNSQIRVDYGEKFRRVHLLQGEALFTVAHYADRPFRVYAGDGRIEALGTAFSVYLKGGDVNVTVAEGRVSVASVNPSRRKDASGSAPRLHQAAGAGPDLEVDMSELLGTLNAGQVAIIRSSVAAGNVSVLETAEPIAAEEFAKRLAWSEGMLMFSGDTLEEVVNEISRYTTVSIEIPDAAVRNMRVGGRFPVGDTEVMFAALESNFNLRVTHLSRNRVVLSGRHE